MIKIKLIAPNGQRNTLFGSFKLQRVRGINNLQLNREAVAKPRPILDLTGSVKPSLPSLPSFK
jgi:hypothetical protein